MIKTGELNHFLKDLRDKLGPRDDRQTENRERYWGEVMAISRGSVLDKDNKTANKKNARQVYNLYQFNQEK